MCLFPGERGLGSVLLTALFPHKDPSSSPRKPQLRTQVSGGRGTVRSGPPGTRESPVLSRVETSLSRVVPFLAAELPAAECLLSGPGPPALFSTSLALGAQLRCWRLVPSVLPLPAGARGSPMSSVATTPCPDVRGPAWAQNGPHMALAILPGRPLSGQFPEWWDTGSSPPL